MRDPSSPRTPAARRRSRRRFVVAAGTSGLVAGALGLVGALARSVVPDVLYEPPRRFPVGRPADFPPGSVTFVSERRLFVFNTPTGFYVVSAVCTHLGCNVNHEPGRGFACPCHGSAFEEDGRVRKGPAAWPLPRFAVVLTRRGELVVDTRRTVGPDFRLRA
ncbi:MAG TPA: Rieske (2Fe-2S) protein [Vicinamibacteria bacterium]|nr:Rieske (2Fe-2S) protein [Vicinamibacteria bacterium]